MAISHDRAITELRTRLAALEAQIALLREIHLRQGDRLAGKLMARVEREREQVLSQLTYVH